MRADRMAEVELVEPAGDGVPDEAAGRASRLRGRRVLRRWWPVPAAALTVLVGWQALDGSADEVAAERLRATPGVIGTTVTAPLGATPWGDEVAADVLADPFRAPDGLWAGAIAPARGAPADLVGIDPATGAEVWRRALAPAPPPGGYVLVTDCTSGEDPARVLWCVVADGSAPGAPGAVPTRLLRVDLTDRTVARAEELAPGSAAIAVGSALVVATSGTEDIDLVATDAVSGELRWRAAVPDPLGGSGGRPGPVLSVSGGHLLVGGLTRTWSLDPGTGAVEASGPVLLVVRGDRLAEVVGSSRTRLRGEDGAGTAEVEGQALQPAPDDGSAADLLLVRVLDGTAPGLLRAVDARTGEVVWERTGSGSVVTNHLLLGGVLYGSTRGAVWAVDVRTGADVWSTPGEPGDTGRLMTDGRALLRTERVAGTGQRVLAAYGLDGGRRAWSTPLPPGVDQVWTQDGVLYGRTADGVVLLG